MNPLLLKIGLPAIIFAAIAFMKWSNAKATGSPVFPGLADPDAPRNGKGGGGNALPDINATGDKVAEVNTVGSTTGGDESAGSDIGTSYATNDTSIASINPRRQVTQETYLSGAAAYQEQHTDPVSGAYTGGYIHAEGAPSSPTPTTQLPTPQFSGSGGGRTFAI